MRGAKTTHSAILGDKNAPIIAQYRHNPFSATDGFASEPGWSRFSAGIKEKSTLPEKE
jgi:hypothetical protein